MKQPNLEFVLILFKILLKKTHASKRRGAILLLIVITLVSALTTVYSVTSSLLLTNIKLAEEKNTYQSVNEILQDYTKVADDIYYINLTWAKWDDTYEFIQSPQKAYIKENFTPEIFSNWNFDLAVLVNKRGKDFFSLELDKKNPEKLVTSTLLTKQIYPENILVQNPSSGKSLKGILALPKGIMLISSLPVLNNGGNKPSRGAFIFGRYVQKSEIIKRISGNNYLTVPISLYSVNEPQMPPDFEEARLALSDKKPIVVQNLSGQTIAGYTWLKDIYGKPTLLVRIEKDRELYLQSKSSLNYLRVSLIIVGLIFGITAQLFLQQLITFQLKRKESEARYRIVVG